MSVVLNDLFEKGLMPQQIYEICIPDGEYKKHLIESLPRGYHHTVAICDRFFKDLKQMTAFVEKLSMSPNLLVVDISELCYIGFIKDSTALKQDLQRFYNRIEAMAKLGTTCVIFVNFFYYYLIFQELRRPKIVQIHTFPSDIEPFWEARITNPPELQGRKSLFNPFSDEIPFVNHF